MDAGGRHTLHVPQNLTRLAPSPSPSFVHVPSNSLSIPSALASASSLTARRMHARSLSVYDSTAFTAFVSFSTSRAIVSSNRSTTRAAASSSALGVTTPGSPARVAHAHANPMTANATITPCVTACLAPIESPEASSFVSHNTMDALTESEVKRTTHQTMARHPARSLDRAREMEIAREVEIAREMDIARSGVGRSRADARARRRTRVDVRSLTSTRATGGAAWTRAIVLGVLALARAGVAEGNEAGHGVVRDGFGGLDNFFATLDEREVFAAARDSDVAVALLIPHCAMCKNYAHEFRFVASLYDAIDAKTEKKTGLTFVEVPDARETPNVTAAFGATNAPFVALLKRKRWYYVTASGETKIRAPKRFEGELNAKETVEWLNYALGLEPERRAVVPPDVDELTLDTVDAYAKDEEYDTVIEFYAEWCGHCKAFKKDYERVGAHYARERRVNGGRVKIGRLNVDNARSAAAKYNITGLPTVVLFKRGHKEKGVIYKGSKKTSQRVMEFIESPGVALTEMAFRDMDPWKCFASLRDEGLITFDDTLEKAVTGETVTPEECDKLVHRIVAFAEERGNRQQWHDTMKIMTCMSTTPQLKNTPSGNSHAVWNLLDNAKYHVEHPSEEERERREEDESKNEDDPYAKWRMVNGEIDWGAVRREQAEAWRREREKHGLDRAEVDEILEEEEWFDFASQDDGGAIPDGTIPNRDEL